jgi:glutamate-1-semialdehyde 2,1-aminomutase
LCAGLATIKLLEQPGFYEALEKKATRLVEALRQKIPGTVTQVGSLFTPFFGVTEVRAFTTLDQGLYARFFKHLFAHNIYFVPSPYEANFLSSAHSEDDIDYTIEAIKKFNQ